MNLENFMAFLLVVGWRVLSQNASRIQRVNRRKRQRHARPSNRDGERAFDCKEMVERNSRREKGLFLGWPRAGGQECNRVGELAILRAANKERRFERGGHPPGI
jgi:hypothetical protein